MHEQLRDRILRKLESLNDERAYQVLDYLEFLESKYAQRSAPTNIFAKLKEKAEDTLRAGKFSAETIGSTLGAMDSAQKIVKGIVAAGGAVVEEAAKAAGVGPKSGTPPASPGGEGK
ncbi:MAG TPA: hypothetical protein VFS07_04880 [Gemmatimonadales bacterium]|jgi:hypothetical protein|nr:hypothetical protein [Gemmatimonadales bacterium]